ncbi:transmembrane 9 superfamily member 1-like [Olea europaea var. sylvestris]|uniref:transmembrane 9 superfamily member 1-like n=1 Tax=Olea europaea var. sylvestris TaxID=158386 RepID=UPI000C1D1180|nr:transmembrane 9 superfamily member 1-like [Olea europaea var. sylvestris]
MQYQQSDPVTLWVNKVGPYNNPQETYNYYSLPFCHPDGHAAHKWGGLGEVLGGNELIDSLIDIKFQKPVDRATICELELDEAKVQQFKDAIENNYWFEFFMGHKWVKDIEDWDSIQRFHHCALRLQLVSYSPMSKDFHHEKIPEFEVETNRESRAGLHLKIPTSYSKSNQTYGGIVLGHKSKFLNLLSLIASMISLKLFCLHSSIDPLLSSTAKTSSRIQILAFTVSRTEFSNAVGNDEEPSVVLTFDYPYMDHTKRISWRIWLWCEAPKSMTQEVFFNLGCSGIMAAYVFDCSGLFWNVSSPLNSVMKHKYFEKKKNMWQHACLFCWTLFFLLSVLQLYFELRIGFMYNVQLTLTSILVAGKNWIKSMILTASLFPFLCFMIGFILNTIAIFYGSLAAIPFGTMVVVFVIWAFISFPLALLGTVVGRNWSGAPNNPCRVKTIPRPIPEKKWYLTPSVVSLMGGLLPFGSIFIEMYFVFTSFWNYKVYYVYGFMLLVFVILVIVTMCVTIVGTYFLLNAENYNWQWTSFFSAFSTAFYVYLYSVYYYHVKTKMSGFFQTSFYFGYTLMFCLGLGILCGAVGYLGSNLFVRRIYRNIKCD